MSATHTQGPWFTHYEGAVLHVIPCTRPTAGTVQICTANGTAYRAKSETEANFRLIAAAPELLAMLEAIRTAYDNAASHGHAIPSELVRAIGESAAITAKAKGWATA